MAGAVQVQVVSGVCPCCARLRECVWWMGINEKWKAAMEALPSLPGDYLTRGRSRNRSRHFTRLGRYATLLSTTYDVEAAAAAPARQGE